MQLNIITRVAYQSESLSNTLGIRAPGGAVVLITGRNRLIDAMEKKNCASHVFLVRKEEGSVTVGPLWAEIVRGMKGFARTFICFANEKLYKISCWLHYYLVIPNSRSFHHEVYD